MRNTKRNIDFVTDVYTGKINRCCMGMKQRIVIAEKIYSRSGGEGTKKEMEPKKQKDSCTMQISTCLMCHEAKYRNHFLGAGRWAGEGFDG